jgi:hypothetical protein
MEFYFDLKIGIHNMKQKHQKNISNYISKGIFTYEY